MASLQRNILIAVTAIFSGSVCANEVGRAESPEALVESLQTAFKKRDLDGILDLYCWDGVHLIHQDDEYLKWNSRFAMLDDIDLRLTVSMEWVAIADFEFPMTTAGKPSVVRDRIYRPNLKVLGAILYRTKSQISGAIHQQPVLVGKDQSGSWRLTAITVEQDEPLKP